MKILTPKDYMKLQRITEGEPVLWVGRPQTPLRRWISYRLDTVRYILPVFLAVPAGIFFTQSPWAALLFVLCVEVLAVSLLYRKFFDQVYAITDRNIWQIENFSARRPFVRKTPSVPMMRISWTRYQDNLSTFKMTYDLRFAGRVKRVLLARFYDVADGIAVKELLVRGFIQNKDFVRKSPPIPFTRVADAQPARAV